MAESKEINFRDRDDLAYLEAVVDMSPRLLTRADTHDALSDFWREVVKKLILIAKERADGPS